MGDLVKGYEPAPVNLDISAGQTTSFQTNLIPSEFVTHIKKALRTFADGQYAEADEAVKAALLLNPSNEQAVLLQQQIGGLWFLQQAKDSAKNDDYITACQKLKLALQQLPDQVECKQLLAQYEANIPKQIEKIKVDRSQRPKLLFEEKMKAEPNSALFDAHEIKTSLPWSKAEDAIAGALVNCQPRFKVAYPIVYQPEIFDLNARQEFTTALQTSAGYRQVIIVGGQISDEQTEVFFKVFEYKAEAEIKFSIGNMIGAPASVKYVPISASKMVLTEELKNRVTEGEQMVINQIRQALSEP